MVGRADGGEVNPTMQRGPDVPAIAPVCGKTDATDE